MYNNNLMDLSYKEQDNLNPKRIQQIIQVIKISLIKINQSQIKLKMQTLQLLLINTMNYLNNIRSQLK